MKKGIIIITIIIFLSLPLMIINSQTFQADLGYSDITCTYLNDYSDVVIEQGYVHTNLIENGDFSLDSNSDGLADYFLRQNASSYIDNYQYVTTLDNQTYFRLSTSTLPFIKENHKLYYTFDFISSGLIGSGLWFKSTDNGSTSYDDNIFINDNYSDIITGYNDDEEFFYFITYSQNNGTWFGINNFMVFDLTDIYGSGNEPTLEEFEEILLKASNPDIQDWELITDHDYTIGYLDSFDTTVYAKNMLEVQVYNPTAYDTLMSECLSTINIGALVIDEYKYLATFEWTKSAIITWLSFKAEQTLDNVVTFMENQTVYNENPEMAKFWKDLVTNFWQWFR